jgi:hypothetical protein
MLYGVELTTIASDIWMGRTWEIKDFLWCFALFQRKSSMIIYGSNTLCYR